MLQMASFGTILDSFGPKAAQMLRMVSFGTILDHFGPKAAEMLQMVSFGAILDNFGPKSFFKIGPLGGCCLKGFEPPLNDTLRYLRGVSLKGV